MTIPQDDIAAVVKIRDEAKASIKRLSSVGVAAMKPEPEEWREALRDLGAL